MIRSSTPASVRLVVPPEHDGARLDLFLAAATALSRRTARALVAAGGVLRNGESLRVQSRSLVAGDAIDVLGAPAELGVPVRPTIPAPAILFEDAWLVVVDKPAGVLSQPAESSTAGELTIEQQLLLFLAARDGRRPFLRLVHRLDRSTSGAVLFARSQETLPRLAEAWRSGQVDRRYLAVVAGDPAFDALEVDRPIGRDPDHQWRFRVDPAGRPARTSIRILARHAGRSALVECRLLTGRTHQVRVHLAAAGHPVVGDRLYGAPFHPCAARPLLHAAGLELPHPKSGQRLRIASPLPAEFGPFIEAQREPPPAAPTSDGGLAGP
ncbi:MAG: RluA family pseudouridine synthase [Holophagae bacterium]|nr:MAG: RluA family pseudouridine synthase [Holophagae bacterium]